MGRVSVLLLVIVVMASAIVTIACWPRRSHQDTERICGRTHYEYSHVSKPQIRFNSEGQLKLANFADLHFGENPESDWGPEQDRKSKIAMKKILDLEHPDFVIFTGDQLTAENMFSNGSDYVDILVAPLVEGNYSWASVYGNHDVGPNVKREEIYSAEVKYNLSYTQHSPSGVAGVTNYFLPIYAHGTGESSRNPTEEYPIMIWWFFDTRGGKDATGSIPEHMDCTAVSWFQRENQRMIDEWGPLPSLAFMHIPTDEFVKVQTEVSGNSHCSGLVDDTVTPQDQQNGILQALVDSGTVKTVFVGHDHGNAWCCFYGPLELCYNRHTGYGGYGKWDRGSRIIQLDERNLMNRTNYIRMENGEILDRFPK